MPVKRDPERVWPSVANLLCRATVREAASRQSAASPKVIRHSYRPNPSGTGLRLPQRPHVVLERLADDADVLLGNLVQHADLRRPRELVAAFQAGA